MGPLLVTKSLDGHHFTTLTLATTLLSAAQQKITNNSKCCKLVQVPELLLLLVMFSLKLLEMVLHLLQKPWLRHPVVRPPALSAKLQRNKRSRCLFWTWILRLFLWYLFLLRGI